MCKKKPWPPKSVDRDAALDKAMKLFWQHGYEALLLRTSLKRPEPKRPRYTRIYQQRGVIPRRTRPLYRSFCAKHEAQLFCEEKSVESALADILLPSPTALPAKTLRLAASYQQLHHPLPGFRRYRQYAEIRHAMQERTLQQFLCQRQARGKSRPTVT